MKTRGVMLCGAVIACAVIGIVIYGRFSSDKKSSVPNSQRANEPAANSHNAALTVKPRVPPIAFGNTSKVETASAKLETETNSLTSDPLQKTSLRRTAKEPLQDPVARDALALVGFDPEAELYWFAAINDLSLPANERQDLIEDLNEEGLPDPEHPTPDDLPLILNRLAIIETVGPDAADKVNADAFLEAYKDLLNLAELAMGGGEPVK